MLLSHSSTLTPEYYSLRNWLPVEFFHGEYNDTPAMRYEACQVVVSYNVGVPHPFTHRNISSWCVVLTPSRDYVAVGFNENVSRGWSFPVVKYTMPVLDEELTHMDDNGRPLMVRDVVQYASATAGDSHTTPFIVQAILEPSIPEVGGMALLAPFLGVDSEPRPFNWNGDPNNNFILLDRYPKCVNEPVNHYDRVDHPWMNMEGNTFIHVDLTSLLER